MGCPAQIPFIGCAHSPGDCDYWLPAALSAPPGQACPWLKGSYLAGELGTHSHPRPSPVCDAARTPSSAESPSWLSPSPSSPTESTSLQGTFSGVPTQRCFPETRPQVPPPFPGCANCLVVKSPPEVPNPRMLPGRFQNSQEDQKSRVTGERSLAGSPTRVCGKTCIYLPAAVPAGRGVARDLHSPLFARLYFLTFLHFTCFICIVFRCF